MKRIIFLLFITTLCAAIFAGCEKQEPVSDQSWDMVQKSGKFVLGFDASFPPMGFRDGDEYVGFDIDLAKEAAKRLNTDLVLQPIKWDVKEQELNTRKIDCIWNGFTMTPEREAMLTFTAPYMNNKQVLIVKSNSPIDKPADLKGKRLALQRNSSASDALMKHPELKNSLKEILQFEDNLMAMTDLDTGNCDAVLMDIVVANYNYLSKSPGRYKILDASLADERFAVGFRKGDTALKNKIEDTLKDMAKDGTMAEISIKWFGADITIFKQK